VSVRSDAAHARRILAHRLQVGAGAELAVRAGEHRDGERLVGIEAAERLASASAVGRSIALATSGRSMVITAIGPSAR